MDRSKWRKMIRGTVIMIVILWAEYELYISDAGSTWVNLD